MINKNTFSILCSVLFLSVSPIVGALQISVETHDGNSSYLIALLKFCDVMDKLGASQNASCRVFMGNKSTKEDASHISQDIYNFSLISADRAYKNKYSSIDSLSVDINFVTQIYRRKVFLLAAPSSNIKSVKDLKGKKVLVTNTDFMKAFANILNAHGIQLHQVKVSNNTVNDNGQNRCMGKDIDAVFYEGPDKDPKVADFVWACKYKVIPIILTEKLKAIYPYYKSTTVVRKKNNGKGVPSITVPVVALSSTDTSYYRVGFFLETFFNHAIALDKILQTIDGKAVDYMENVTSLPMHPAAFEIKQKLKGNN